MANMATSSGTEVLIGPLTLSTLGDAEDNRRWTPQSQTGIPSLKEGENPEKEDTQLLLL